MTSLAVVVLGSVQLVFDLRAGKTGPIMDIGMRSAGMEGARKAALLMASIAAVFVALVHVIDLRYAAMLFPLGPTVLFLKGRMRWIGAAVGLSSVAVFKLLVLDYLLPTA